MDYRKFIEPLIYRRKILFTLLLAFIEILDLITLSLFSIRKFPRLSESILIKFQFDSLHFRPTIYEDALNFTTYVIAFIFGGILAFLVVKLTGKIAMGTGLINYEILSLVPMCLFILIFLSGCLFSGWKPNWVNPLLANIGGALIYFLSRVKFEVNV